MLAFKDVGPSVLTALYDLFNKSYTQKFKYNYCKVTMGCATRQNALVGETYNSIVYVFE